MTERLYSPSPCSAPRFDVLAITRLRSHRTGPALARSAAGGVVATAMSLGARASPIIAVGERGFPRSSCPDALAKLTNACPTSSRLPGEWEGAAVRLRRGSAGTFEPHITRAHLRESDPRYDRRMNQRGRPNHSGTSRRREELRGHELHVRHLLPEKVEWKHPLRSGARKVCCTATCQGDLLLDFTKKVVWRARWPRCTRARPIPGGSAAM